MISKMLILIVSKILNRKFYRSFSIVTLMTGLFLISMQSEVYSQEAVDNAAIKELEQIERDRAVNERQRQLEQQRFENQPPKGDIIPPPQEDVTPLNEKCVDVNTISVTGASLIHPQLINRATKPFENKCVGISTLNNILKQLTFLYVDRGYVTSRAFLPEQDLADGSLEIVVVEGTLESIVINEKPDNYKSQISTAFPALIGKPVNLRHLEQGLDQLNRLRVNNATIELKAGKEQGSSLLAVSKNKGKKKNNWHGNIGLDNLGSSTTGGFQAKLNMNFEDLLALSDKWSLNYIRSMNYPYLFADVPSSNSLSGSLSIPYGYSTFSINGSLSDNQSEIERPGKNVDTNGNSQSFGVSLSQIVHRNQTSKTSLAYKLKWKQTENFVLGSRIDVTSRTLTIGTLGLVHSRRFWNGQLVASVDYNRGLSILDAFDDRNAPLGSPKGQFESFVFSLNYLRPFRLGNLRSAYNGQITAQYSPHLLFGSEQIAYGGHSTVRGLQNSAVSGNDGIMMRNEITLPLQEYCNLNAYGAIDFGHTFKENSHGIEGGHLAGATIGLRNRNANATFDISYSDIILSSENLSEAVSKSGLLSIKLNLSF